MPHGPALGPQLCHQKVQFKSRTNLILSLLEGMLKVSQVLRKKANSNRPHTFRGVLHTLSGLLQYLALLSKSIAYLMLYLHGGRRKKSWTALEAALTLSSDYSTSW